MPGKVNPVIPESVSQVAYSIAGADVTVSMAVEAGQLQLNAFEPIIAHSLFQSVTWLERACRTLRVNCVDGITANTDKRRGRRCSHCHRHHRACSGHWLCSGGKVGQRGSGHR